jgi:hypothetical protein
MVFFCLEVSLSMTVLQFEELHSTSTKSSCDNNDNDDGGHGNEVHQQLDANKTFYTANYFQYSTIETFLKQFNGLIFPIANNAKNNNFEEKIKKNEEFEFEKSSQSLKNSFNSFFFHNIHANDEQEITKENEIFFWNFEHDLVLINFISFISKNFGCNDAFSINLDFIYATFYYFKSAEKNIENDNNLNCSLLLFEQFKSLCNNFSLEKIILRILLFVHLNDLFAALLPIIYSSPSHSPMQLLKTNFYSDDETLGSRKCNHHYNNSSSSFNNQAEFFFNEKMFYIERNSIENFFIFPTVYFFNSI